MWISMNLSLIHILKIREDMKRIRQEAAGQEEEKDNGNDVPKRG